MKLVCFGDSFIDTDHATSGPGIAHLVSEQVKLPLLNYGQSSTGIEYSLNCLYRYLTGSKYDPTDYLIFVPSSEHRLWFEKLGSNRFALPNQSSADPKVNDFVREHSQEINWVLENIIPSLELKTLHAYAIMHSLSLRGHKCLIVNPFPVSETARHVIQSYHKTENFRCLLALPSLLHYSVNEFVDPSKIVWANEHRYNRINHFSRINVKILADQFTQELQGLDAFDTSKLKQGFLT